MLCPSPPLPMNECRMASGSNSFKTNGKRVVLEENGRAFHDGLDANSSIVEESEEESRTSILSCSSSCDSEIDPEVMQATLKELQETKNYLGNTSIKIKTRTLRRK